jgi:hypothetical protein
MKVPVSKDGSRFDPRACCRDGGFWVGEKGNEQKIMTFADALRALRATKVPRWRRPNTKNHWGLVTGVRWEHA